jgi:hypothetical protein
VIAALGLACGHASEQPAAAPTAAPPPTSSATVGGGLDVTDAVTSQVEVDVVRARSYSIRSAVLLYLGEQAGAECPTIADLVTTGALDSTDATTDPWGGLLRIECDGDDILVLSAGPDRELGTEDDVITD